MGMAYEQILWRCDSEDIRVGLERTGSGPSVLLLPALSSISTRRELGALHERLAVKFAAVSVDWPGFGDLARPRLDWRPELYVEFLDHLLAAVAPSPYAIIAAGHAAGYVLRHSLERGRGADRLVLLSPTWREPLPTMMGGDRPAFARIARAFDPAVIGPVLYRLNVNRLMLGVMARGHVYSDPHWLRGPRMEEKRAVVHAVGARHASARFVTGGLDPFRSRDDFLRAARDAAVPILSVFSERAPRKSRSEMEALANLPNVTTARLSHGKLSFYEEFPDETYAAVRDFL